MLFENCIQRKDNSENRELREVKKREYGRHFSKLVKRENRYGQHAVCSGCDKTGNGSAYTIERVLYKLVILKTRI